MREVLSRMLRQAEKRLRNQAEMVELTRSELDVANRARMVALATQLDAKLKRQIAAANATKAQVLELEAQLASCDDPQTDVETVIAEAQKNAPPRKGRT